MALTFRDSEKTKEHNTIAVGSLNVIVYVTDRQINGPILIVPSSYGYGRLIATKNDGTKDRAVSIRILSNNILA